MKITVSTTQNSKTKPNKFWRRSRTTTTKKNVTNESKERSDWNYTSRRVRTTRNWRRNDLTKNADAVDLLLRSDSIFFFVYDSTIFSQRFGYLWYMWKKWNFIKGLSSRDWAERNIGLEREIKTDGSKKENKEEIFLGLLGLRVKTSYVLTCHKIVCWAHHCHIAPQQISNFTYNNINFFFK